MSLNEDLSVFLDLATEAVVNGDRSALHDLPADQAYHEYEAATHVLDVPGPQVASVQELCIRSLSSGYSTFSAVTISVSRPEHLCDKDVSA